MEKNLCSKRKRSDGSIRKRRKCSLKNLSFLDNIESANSFPAEMQSNSFEKDNLFESSFSKVSDDEIDVISTQIGLKTTKSPQRLQDKASILIGAPRSEVNNSKESDWPDDTDLLDHDMLQYVSSMKNNISVKTENHKADLTCSKNCRSATSLLNDSWFENIDLSLLEQDCIKNKSIVEEQQATKLQSVEIGLKECLGFSGEQGYPIAASTPNAIKSCGSFAKRVKSRLVANAHKSPQPALKLAKVSGVKKSVDSLQLNGNDFSSTQLTIENVSTQDVGPFYGLPSKVKKLLEDLRGIKSLYDWQHDCLTREEVKMGKNLIYCLPTSGGKTLVAEIIIMKTLLCKKKNAVLVLPFVAIVQEKIQNLSQFAVELGFLIEEYAGSKGRFPPRKRRKRNVLYICTIEKSNSLINSLIENDRLDEVSLVVVDEFHMIGEGGRRGATIETMLTKVLHISASTQIVAMSATLGNTGELASFLKAKIYRNDFRPVDLDEYVKVMSSLYKLDPTKLHPDDRLMKDRTLTYATKDMAEKDTDHLASLVLEVVPEHSCLIFCPTKKNCENVAVLICKALPKKLLKHLQSKKADVLKALHNEGGTVCPVLWETIPYGIAYHHSGLTTDERRIIEEGYRSEVLSVITCTSTLAAGVNLPARRVIIRSPHIGRGFLSRAQYKQMIGRAGRAGIDTKGESYLIVNKPEDQMRVAELVVGPMETCISSLMYDNGKGFKALLLNLIGLKVVSKKSDVESFFSQTLFSRQIKRIEKMHPELMQDIVLCCDDEQKITVESIASSSMKYLLDLNLIVTVSDDEMSFKPTKLGIATHRGGVDLNVCSNLYKDLKRGLETLVLDSYLHLLYLVTPYETAKNVTPNWLIYMSEMNRLTPTELSAATFVGVPEHYVARRASGNNPRRKKVDEAVVRRFYVTLMLYELFKGNSVWEVSARYEQPRGFLQNLLSSTAAFASCALHFAKEFEEFWPLHALLEKLIQVLQYCSISELVPLMEIPAVQLARAKQLYKAGYKSLAHIAGTSCSFLQRDIEYLSKKQALQIIASAKVLLTEKIESLQEEAEELKNVTT